MLKPSPEYLAELTGYAEGGIAIVVSKIYPFSSFKKAYTEVPSGKFIGKSVITMDGVV
jgi:D-arabinose 1-dehydrogenase-like Zn-dependent alcohol dehydrogenase